VRAEKVPDPITRWNRELARGKERDDMIDYVLYLKLNKRTVEIEYS
jgi:hypothetical protein